MALGLASGWMKMTLEDPELWKILPGGVPYIYRTEKRQDMIDKITTAEKAIKLWQNLLNKKRKSHFIGFFFFLPLERSQDLYTIFIFFSSFELWPIL